MNNSALITLLLASSVTQLALAHTELSETVPADHAMIAAAPENVQLRFSEPVRLTALTIQMDGESKRSLGPLPPETSEQFSVALPALDDGHYIVSWRALSEDTHVMTGEFMFVIGESGTHAEHMNQGSQDEHGAAH